MVAYHSILGLFSASRVKLPPQAVVVVMYIRFVGRVACLRQNPWITLGDVYSERERARTKAPPIWKNFFFCGGGGGIG